MCRASTRAPRSDVGGFVWYEPASLWSFTCSLDTQLESWPNLAGSRFILHTAYRAYSGLSKIENSGKLHECIWKDSCSHTHLVITCHALQSGVARLRMPPFKEAEPRRNTEQQQHDTRNNRGTLLQRWQVALFRSTKSHHDRYTQNVPRNDGINRLEITPSNNQQVHYYQEATHCLPDRCWTQESESKAYLTHCCCTVEHLATESRGLESGEREQFLRWPKSHLFSSQYSSECE